MTAVTQTERAPADIDELTRQEELALADFKRAIPRRCFRPVPLRAWATLARIVATIAACLFVLSRIEVTSGARLWIEVPALVAMWVVYGWVLVGLFVLGHDCGHYAFSRRRRVNEWIGHLCMAPLGNGFRTWRLTHDHHHEHTQLRGQEVDWAANLVTEEEFARLTWRDHFVTKLGYAIPFGPFFWIAVNTVRRGLLRHEMLRKDLTPALRRELAISTAIMVLAMTGIFGGLWAWLGVWGLLKYHAIPLAVTIVTGSLIVTIQHAGEGTLLYAEDGWTPVRGQLVSTFDVRFPAPIEWLWCDINIHVPHHIAPGVPWYRLREAGRALRERFPGYYQERPFRLRDLLWFARAPFLRPVPGRGYYALAAAGASPSASPAPTSTPPR